ncbi:hypothetical protein PAAG_06555 [Paracoccidioides lutzii Pb01]|uniref:Uncharacterized protein n=1 Tax=Paracoccidioides lutzii (strain ATCC MYA-826 / Pb01) TaxID=502779 RepID=C1H714_PARBA|nr:hypothetical protein PAAG_06555 [Paracoccidioides lutzii Pb01]EEH35508.2 hypothetical protein PAAG_06555 [Paracoccidioides lutzii Pb01]
MCIDPTSVSDDGDITPPGRTVSFPTASPIEILSTLIPVAWFRRDFTEDGIRSFAPKGRFSTCSCSSFSENFNGDKPRRKRTPWMQVDRAGQGTGLGWWDHQPLLFATLRTSSPLNLEGYSMERFRKTRTKFAVAID